MRQGKFVFSPPLVRLHRPGHVCDEPCKRPDMPSALALPLRLRLASSAAFLLAVLVAAGANRSLLMVPILAAASTAAHWMASRLAKGDQATMLGLLDPRTQRLMQQKMARAGFFFGLFGYTLIFIIGVFLSAIVTPTELARQLTRFDLWLVLAPTGLTLGLGLVRRNLSTPFQGPGNPASSPDPDSDAFTVEGEIVRSDESDP